MKLPGPEQRETAGNLFFSLLISLAIFSLLPAAYYLFHRELYETMKQGTVASVETIAIEEPKKKKDQIKTLDLSKKSRSRRVEDPFDSRFKLDLRVLSAGDGASGFAADTDTIIEEGEADIPPIRRIFVPPEYPRLARERGVEGVVEARILIDEKGNVRRVIVTKAPKNLGFEEAVKEAVSRWKFEPAKLNRLPVKVWAVQEIDFRL